MPQRCAVLDDYQNVALKVADWSSVAPDLEIKVFNAPLGNDDAVIAALKDFSIICAMRERTRFSRRVLEALPKLKLLITTGMRNASIDVKAANERGITVCGTGVVGNPTVGIAVGLTGAVPERFRALVLTAGLAGLRQGELSRPPPTGTSTCPSDHDRRPAASGSGWPRVLVHRGATPRARPAGAGLCSPAPLVGGV